MKFAIIMPVYNKELFVKKAIQSIIRQTYNLKKPIDLILVNDGSTDASGAICESFAQKIPEQITYVKTDNRGPAAARNYGFTFVGKNVDMVGYVDADDFLGLQAVKQVNAFLGENDVDMVTLPVRYFTSKRVGAEHSLNHRFRSGDARINVHHAYDAIHFYAGGLFIKRTVLEQQAPFFEESLQFWEDAYSINRYLLKQPTYGVVANTYYYYRKSDGENRSVVDAYWHKKERYTDLVKKGYQSLMKQSLELHGEVLPFIQYLIAFHMKLYLFNSHYRIMKQTLSSSERDEFIHSVYDTLQQIDPRYIQEQQMKLYYKSFLRSLKRDGWPMKFTMEKADLSKEKVVIKEKRPTLKGLKIRASLSEEMGLLHRDDTVYMMSGKRKIPCTFVTNGRDVDIWDVPTGSKAGIEFEVVVPYHALDFTFYVKRGQAIVALSRFNYYKRAVRKAMPDTKWLK